MADRGVAPWQGAARHAAALQAPLRPQQAGGTGLPASPRAQRGDTLRPPCADGTPAGPAGDGRCRPLGHPRAAVQGCPQRRGGAAALAAVHQPVDEQRRRTAVALCRPGTAVAHRAGATPLVSGSATRTDSGVRRRADVDHRGRHRYREGEGRGALCASAVAGTGRRRLLRPARDGDPLSPTGGLYASHRGRCPSGTL